MIVGNVLPNDTYNGAPVTASQVTISVVDAVPPELTFDTATGDVSTVDGAPVGTYSFTYQICEVLNPGNCDTAVVTVTIGANAIVANTDTLAPINGLAGGTSTESVLDNDTINGAPVVASEVTLTPGTAPAPAAGSITMNADGTITVAAGTTAGTYTYNYTICEVANPGNCSSSTATVTVEAAVLIANDDTFSAVQG